MSKPTDTYRTVPFPPSRRLVIDSMRLGRRKYII
jgi:hypothetical protein